MDIEEYIEAHIDAEPDHLHRLYRQTYLTRLYPHMCSGHMQGRVLAMLTRMIAPRRVLELGTFSGYSALCFAEAMAEGTELHTIEIDDEIADSLRNLFADSPGGEKITLHIGDAAEIIPTLKCLWDLVFIDANKRRYCDYYKLVLPRVRPGGYILADNTLWGGKIVDTESHDRQTEGILEFNDLVAADDNVEKVILPLRDGLTIIRKKD